MEISSGQESHLPHALGHVVQQKLGIVHANATNFYGAARSIDVGRVHQANGSSTRKRAAIIQRMKNEVVQRCEEDESEKEQQQYKVPEETVSKETVVASGEISREEALKRTDERIKKEIDDIMNENKGKMKKDRYRPTKISAVIDIHNGNMYIGYSGKKETNRTPNADKEIHPELSDRIKRTQESAKNEEGNPHKNSESFEEWSVDNCAEVYAVNNALYNGVPWDKMYINTWFFAAPRYAPPCENCKRTFSGVEGLRRGESG